MDYLRASWSTWYDYVSSKPWHSISSFFGKQYILGHVVVFKDSPTNGIHDDKHSMVLVS